MKFNHNKKRNTAFLYEMLIVELSKASMTKDNVRKNKLVFLLKEYFSKDSGLRRDLDIYRSFDDVSDLDGEMVKQFIQEAKKQFNFLNRKDIFNQQSALISEINKNFDSSIWANFVPNFKKLATINQAITRGLPPKKQILIEKKLFNILSTVPSQKKPFPNINNLAVKTFVERFNRQYGETLGPEQKKLLGNYIMSSNDDGVEFKMYFYEEISRLKDIFIKKMSDGSSMPSKRLQEIIDRMNEYNTRRLGRDLISEVVKIQALAREINQ